MIHKIIPLSETNHEVYLEVFVADKVGEFVRDALLVFPGGGYRYVCAHKEGEPVALAFLAKGYNTFVLHYSVGEHALFPQPLIDASRAVKHIRDHAEEYHINPDRIFGCGFSAGGHLCASLGTLWHRKDIYEKAGIPFGSNKIAGMVLNYPVITPFVLGTHMPSFYGILGTEKPTQKELEQYSLDLCVDEHTVPAFLMHTATDPVVAVANTLTFARALTDHKIRCEVHIFPEGPHGIALANEISCFSEPEMIIPAAAQWVDLANEWMKSVDTAPHHCK